MARIIIIETSTSLCSTALSVDGETVASRCDAGRNHAALTVPFIKDTLTEAGLTVQDCHAVCVSAGPGSYTGLRVGSSTAKGLCFGAGLPLIALSSLDALVQEALKKELAPQGCKYIIPMIDARRMEVFSAVYAATGERLGPIAPVVVDEGSFAGQRADGPVLFIGDGAAKCLPLLGGQGHRFVECQPKAVALAAAAEKAYNEKRFEDIAYFEPLYLKDFIATVSRKKFF